MFCLYASLRRFPLSVVVFSRNQKDKGVSSILFLDGGGGGLDVVGEPGQTLEEAFTGRGTAGHDVPDLVFELGELESLGDFLG